MVERVKIYLEHSNALVKMDMKGSHVKIHAMPTRMIVNTEENALNLLFLGDINRAIGETEMNQSSSRSHCIFTIMVEKRLNDSDSVIRSKLNLVDLAVSVLSVLYY